MFTQCLIVHLSFVQIAHDNRISKELAVALEIILAKWAQQKSLGLKRVRNFHPFIFSSSLNAQQNLIIHAGRELAQVIELMATLTACLIAFSIHPVPIWPNTRIILLTGGSGPKRPSPLLGH